MNNIFSVGKGGMKMYLVGAGLIRGVTTYSPGCE